YVCLDNPHFASNGGAQPASCSNNSTVNDGFCNYLHGNQVEILPEFQDPGDDGFIWVVLSDEEKGRVDIRPVN
ncbi:MAG: hypothetical protein ACYCY5_06685, partial [Sulfuricella sp.]